MDIIDLTKIPLSISDHHRCPACEEGSLEVEFDHPFLEEKGQDPFPLDAYVCNTCDFYMLSEENMSKLLTEKYRRRGLSYKKAFVSGGSVSVITYQ